MDANFPYRVAKEAELYNGKAEIAYINNAYLKVDDSHLYPINGKFNATKRAIGRLRKVRKDIPMQGLEYCLALENEISNIVNDPKL